ncbi:MAG: PDZ domain-containing protein, partial [Oscillospiraceae bacterium]|nr:PDZ domain-containing protein [Oscillospiraceae bacterium]
MKNKTIRKIAATIAVVMTILPMSVFAEREPLTEGELKAMFVQDVAEHLGVYSAYEDIVPYKLYKEALINVIEKHPEMYEAVLTGMLESIDEYSEYYNETDSKLLTEVITGTIVGIGITFQMGPDGIDVVSVIPNTPAAGAGLEVGDVIVSADDVVLEGMNSDTAATYIRGEEGTTLKLGIKKKDSSRVIYIDVVRAQITQTSVTHKQFTDGENEAMYICIHGFINNTAAEFKNVLDIAAAAGINNLIIDVRDNGGGLFDQAIMMADYIVPKGSVITTEDHKADILDVVYKAQLED